MDTFAGDVGPLWVGNRWVAADGGVETVRKPLKRFEFWFAFTNTLTAGADTIVGTNGNDTINANQVQNAAGTFVDALNSIDSIDGGAGTDTLNLTSAAAVTILAATTVKNVENANITSAGAVNGDVSGWTGLTALKIVSATAATTAEAVTAAATTTVNLTNTHTAAATTGGTISVTGGSTVAVTSNNVNTSTGTDQTAGAVTVTGVAGTSAATVTQTAAVVVKEVFTATFGATADTKTVTFDGVTFTAAGGNGATATLAAAAFTAAYNAVGAANWVAVDNGNGTVKFTAKVGGAVTDIVNAAWGGTTAASTTAAAPTTQGSSLNDGAVTINDVNAGSLTKAATIASVTLTNYANSTISSNALSTLSLSGTAGTLGITSGLTTETVKTLNLTVNNLSGANTITDSSNHFTTIAVTGSTKASTIANIADSAATALTVAGDQVVTFTSLAGLSSLKTVTVSGAAGFAGDVSGIASVTGVDASATSGANTVTVKATQTTYTGGTGVDIVTIDAAPTKAIGGGAGTADELVLNVAAGTFANPSANTNLTGFEVLGLGAAANGSYDATGFTGLHVGVAGINAAAKFTNVAAGATLAIDAAPAQDIFYVLKDATGTADAVALTIGKATTDGLALAGKVVDITGIESVTIASTGKATAGSANTLKLADTTATTSVLKNITITGAQDMTLSDALTGTAKIVSLDASAATGAIDMSGMHVSAAGSTIKGSLTAANVLTGGAGADIITGGAKVDTITSGAGLDVLTGGAGADKFVMALNANGNVYSTITDFTKTVGTVAGDSIDLSGLSNGALVGAVTALGTAVTLASTAAFADFLNAAASGHTAAATNAVVSWFQYSGDTYVLVDNNNADVFTSSVTTGDQVVKLTGLIDLSKAAISATSELLTA
jgi:S-layer protein